MSTGEWTRMFAFMSARAAETEHTGLFAKILIIEQLLINAAYPELKLG